ncbi:hypothetical protein [Legionella maioricensis]|uniref:Lipoprotein n=1 Tax=Legionella maioricensis TaxID=2896528 RepID=A0A9X2IC49_9GAMM|nr:hypothetical protein [Legionella maioricensis]MCL9684876.1 hypothetical protein [Legionella maioricensis]MCL9688952.1 hypothetical protein [Legionella maioricensis]
MSFHKLFRTMSVLIGIICGTQLLSSCNTPNAPVPEVEKGYGGEGGGHGGGGHGGAGGH